MQTAVALYRRRYIPSFDGLRAVLVAGVLLYHLTGAQLFTATGEVSVIAFFALSGFLITFLLHDEHRRRGRIDLKSFFVRRAVRLVPALVVLLCVWTVVAVCFGRSSWITSVPGGGPGGPISPATVAETVGAALAYVTNWLDAFVQYNLWAGYSPLGHLWSLAVEEQFYLVWGPAMVLLCRMQRAGWWITGLALVALVEPVLLYGQGTNRVYFGTDTRMSALLVGAALGWWWRSGHLARLERSRVTSVLGVGSFVALVVAGMGFRHPTVEWQWTGGIVLASLASGGLVTYLANRPVAGVPGILGHPALVWLGQRSYAVYLWGYVFNTWFRSLGVGGVPLVVGATVVTAELSYRFVERPLRLRGRRRSSDVRLLRPPQPAPDPAVVAVRPAGAPAPDLVMAEG